MLLEIFLAVIESFGDVVAEFQLDRIGAENERSPEIGFPLFKDRTQIQKYDVVCTYDEIRGIFVVRGQRVGAGADDALVPVGGDSEHFLGEMVVILIDPALEDVRTDYAPGFDLSKKLVRFFLRLQ